MHFRLYVLPAPSPPTDSTWQFLVIAPKKKNPDWVCTTLVNLPGENVALCSAIPAQLRKPTQGKQLGSLPGPPFSAGSLETDLQKQTWGREREDT